MAFKWILNTTGWSVEPWSPHLRVPCQFVFTLNWSQLIIQICTWTLFYILWLLQVGKPPFEAENNNETYRRITRVDLKSVFTKLFPYQLNLPSIEFNVTAALCHTVRIHLCDKSVLTFNQRSLNRPGFQRTCLKAPGASSRSCLEKNPTRGFPLTRWEEYSELMRCTVVLIYDLTGNISVLGTSLDSGTQCACEEDLEWGFVLKSILKHILISFCETTGENSERHSRV